MWTKVKMWYSDLPFVGKIAVVVAVIAAMFAISAYNGVTY